ncbi:hypothetical protein M404DRAFT_541339 [Pisolithus tinctorius Marx 270]|uniref:Uncharacterized protein n=1 Tax=Pisolithus tinctorius Marx 270 TaxID=870435 RepID=A0A0C3PAA2_PISTI|nr:hypothetical protein M404DRAFT_541339 [Pisolithus tinctorius Marx 270]
MDRTADGLPTSAQTRHENPLRHRPCHPPRRIQHPACIVTSHHLRRHSRSVLGPPRTAQERRQRARDKLYLHGT